MSVFIVLHSGILAPSWFEATPLFGIVTWLKGEAPNPFSCSAMGEIVSVAVTYAVSRLTQPLPESHLEEMFGDAGEADSVAAD